MHTAQIQGLGKRDSFFLRDQTIFKSKGFEASYHRRGNSFYRAETFCSSETLKKDALVVQVGLNIVLNGVVIWRI